MHFTKEEVLTIIEDLFTTMPQTASLKEMIAIANEIIEQSYADKEELYKQAIIKLEQVPECGGCYECFKEMDEKDPLPGLLSRTNSRYILCTECGNKRCPKAADHRNKCSGSNEPGQKGSLYE